MSRQYFPFWINKIIQHQSVPTQRTIGGAYSRDEIKKLLMYFYISMNGSNLVGEIGQRQKINSIFGNAGWLITESVLGVLKLPPTLIEDNGQQITRQIRQRNVSLQKSIWRILSNFFENQTFDQYSSSDLIKQIESELNDKGIHDPNPIITRIYGVLSNADHFRLQQRKRRGQIQGGGGMIQRNTTRSATSRTPRRDNQQKGGGSRLTQSKKPK